MQLIRTILLSLSLAGVILAANLCAATLAQAKGGAAVVATVEPNPLLVAISAPPTVVATKTFTATTTVTNAGNVNVTGAVALLSAPAGFNLLFTHQSLGTLHPHEKRQVNWIGTANTTGKFTIRTEVDGLLGSMPISASATTNVAVITLKNYIDAILFNFCSVLAKTLPPALLRYFPCG
jgi:hypothetical protein